MANGTKQNKRPLAIGGAIIVVLVAVYVLRFLNFELALPTAAKIQVEEKRARELRQGIEDTRKEVLDIEMERLDLVDATAGFWPFETNKIQDRIEQLARRSGLQLKTVGAPNPVPVSEYVRAVDVNINSHTTMKSAAQFIQAIEENGPYRLEWFNCILRPNQPREPTGVQITGKIRAYVLSDDAAKFVAGVDQ
ncbi:MAG: hypothetical protein QGF67_14005 [Lentisphaeria bacterium]|jgi:hypothetical protein|nr:hypothetical protein [Lentisphaeria bacterium]MDP7742552.1 hypothetical protein [Lentisphaeria bacterium]